MASLEASFKKRINPGSAGQKLRLEIRILKCAVCLQNINNFKL